jgi:hypothetical protein
MGEDMTDTGRHIDRRTDRRTDSAGWSPADRQIDRRTDGQTDIQKKEDSLDRQREGERLAPQQNL